MSCFSDGFHIKHVTRAKVNSCTVEAQNKAVMLNVMCNLMLPSLGCDCHVIVTWLSWLSCDSCDLTDLTRVWSLIMRPTWTCNMTCVALMNVMWLLCDQIRLCDLHVMWLMCDTHVTAMWLYNHTRKVTQCNRVSLLFNDSHNVLRLPHPPLQWTEKQMSSLGQVIRPQFSKPQWI